MESIPKLKEIYAKYHEKGLEIYSVAENPDVEYWKTFIKENDMTWVNVCDDQPTRKNSKAWNDYTLHGIPTVILIDGETGTILAREDDLAAILGQLFQ